eukprot:Opistho-1_new@69382
MGPKRTDRLNSLLKEVLSEVILREVGNPHVAPFVTITKVEITKDLHYAKVFISVLGTEEEKERTLQALQSAAGFIAVTASQKVVMRYFPSLTFKIDTSLQHQARIEELLEKIRHERKEDK